VPFLSLQDISKRYGETMAVRDLTLEVERGEFFGLLGPSGCGKTTTLRMIAGLETPDAGSIEFDGRDITRLSPEKRGFGMVFQNYALFPHLNVFENVAFGLRARRRPAAEVKQKVVDALALVRLPGYEGRRVDELSGGQQQRVAIARAIVIEPSLLLFDEPLSNLDVALREETRGELRELVTRLKLTAIYVTHDQDEAFALCDRISVMSDGRILQTGVPRELYEHPHNFGIARFLGRNNLIRAVRQVDSLESGATFKTIDGGHTLHVSTEKDSQAALVGHAVLAIRPEHISISHGASFPADNLLRATIRQVNFAGATTSVQLDAEGLPLEALVLRLVGLSPGDACMVGLPPNRIIVLKDEKSKDQG
jgi:ABC-type Fe3+/spermidine/putrescine transport system ATPase subunit